MSMIFKYLSGHPFSRSWIVFFTTLASTAQTSEAGPQFFEGPVDFWKTKPQTKPEITTKQKEAPLFDWAKYMDPGNSEFFREGDYMPPEAFLEVARRPTDENIKNWFELVERKNAVSTRLAKRIEEYKSRQKPAEVKISTSVESSARYLPAKSLPSKMLPTDDEFERYHIRMYFDSTCPHCHDMFKVLGDLEDRGYKVDAVQMDDGKFDKTTTHVEVRKASFFERTKLGIKAVPTIIVSDLKSKRRYRHGGSVTADALFDELRSRRVLEESPQYTRQ